MSSRRFHQRRAPGCGESRQPRAPLGEGLADTDLRPEAEAAARTVALCFSDSVARRACSVFCETDQYDWVQHSPAPLIADLMLECLPTFVRDQAGQIALAARFGPRNEVRTPIQRAVRANGRTWRILREGYVFIRFRDRKVVVSATRDFEPGGGPLLVIGVRSNKDAADFWSRWEQHARKNSYLRGQAFFADGEIIERTKAYTWDNILLPAKTLSLIRTHVEGFLRNRVRLRELGMKARRGLLLSGPPGTGKTLLGKVLADVLGTSFVWVSPRHVRNPASFSEILAVARFVAPSVVFLEDLDLFAEEREHSPWIGLGELMNQLDGALDNEEIVTIATTNRVEVIERAISNRPGRMDRVIEFRPMDELCRRSLLERRLAKAVINQDDLEHLVAATAEYTGAHLEEVASTLCLLAVEEENERERPARADVAAARAQGDAQLLQVDRRLIDAALEEVHCERKSRLGFHVT